MNSDRINLRRRKQEGTPKCQINLKNRKAGVWFDDQNLTATSALPIKIDEVEFSGADFAPPSVRS